jgi:hypothetical protein
MDIIKIIKDLNLPEDQFAVFGSGPMHIRGIKQSADVDIIVKMPLWNKLHSEHEEFKPGWIKFNDMIEFLNHWTMGFDDIDMLIDTADIFSGVRFVKLEHVLEWKKRMNRDKDHNDIKLIQDWFAEN